jgi:ClpP class serine protease
MPTWNEIDKFVTSRIQEGNEPQVVCDEIRKRYLGELSLLVERPVIAYYSGWLQKETPSRELNITDFDMNGFMAVVHNLDRKSGLDLILHTPGGAIEATRALVEYLYSMFGKDIRVIVPQMAMSAGTMIACASKAIIMGKHSSLGPTDPQVAGGLPAIGVIEEIKTALAEIRADQMKQILWQEVFRRYPPAFIANCERSIAGTKEMVRTWLRENMLSNEADPLGAAAQVVEHLMNYKETTEHGHHFLKDRCEKFGLRVVALEQSPELQEAVLSVHHAYVASFARSKSIKFIENSIGSSWNIAA